MQLIITVDCGIKAIEKQIYKPKNIDLIICDHHTPGPELPNAYAILDPKREDCNYPYKELSGCGVAFKLLQAFCQKTNDSFEELAKLLDLVVVSIGSDIVPITGENRTLAYFGLSQLNTNPQLGLKSIINIAGLENKEIQINDIVFKIGPRINAAGRLESGKTAVELLTSTNEAYVNKIAVEIDCINTNRKELDAEITEHALSMINESEISKMLSQPLFIMKNGIKELLEL